MPEFDALAAKRARLRALYLRDRAERAPTTARGVHHVAILCTDVERTIQFYQNILEFPLTALFENRDYHGSTHFLFDIGHGNSLAFFDFPGLDVGDYREVLGGLHHLALSMESSQWERIKTKLDAAGIAYQEVHGKSLYFRDPDGTRLELTCNVLGSMDSSRIPSERL